MTGTCGYPNQVAIFPGFRLRTCRNDGHVLTCRVSVTLFFPKIVMAQCAIMPFATHATLLEIYARIHIRRDRSGRVFQLTLTLHKFLDAGAFRVVFSGSRADFSKPCIVTLDNLFQTLSTSRFPALVCEVYKNRARA